MDIDIKEKGLETILVDYLRDKNEYEQGQSSEYNKTYALMPERVESFVRKTQPRKVAESNVFDVASEKNKFFSRLRDEITKRGVADVLRRGIKHNATQYDLYYPLPNELNETAKKLYKDNDFTVVRQLHYSETNPMLSVDVVLLLNGIPIVTMELKNHFTGQTTKNAIEQYKTDRDPNDLLFKPKRCAVHFAVDDTDIYMCAQLSGATSWFLPFNKGVNGGKGNPVNPHGLMTAYLWEEVLTKQRLSNILEDFAQIMVSEDEDTHKKKETVIWPRYHQLDAVRKLLNDVKEKGIGQRYLIQHSAGSGKSNSITWLAYQLVGLLDGTQPLVDSVVIVTDRVNLDKQIYNNIMAFQKLKGLVVRANTSEALAEALKGGKKIVTTTVQKFPYILDTIGTILKDRHFALIIDEAHSSQNGAMAAQANMVVSGTDTEDVEDLEDKILKIIEGRKMAKNASYFAFTATPKNKTLQKFGTPLPPDADGNVQHVPFHVYSMKQAIEEGFIMDVLRNYTPYQSFYKIVKSVSSDPEYDKKQATAKLRAWVESQPETIAEKTRIIVEHFHECVINKGKVGGQARAMLVTSGIHRAIEFYYAITKALEARKSPYKAIVAFSGEQEYGGKHVTEASINGFPSAEIEKKIRRDPYRILVVADKFQTGYDEKLLHTMYVDKVLAGVNAVQTLSRLNRCHPKKSDTFVLDFADNAAAVYKAFQEYYKCTILKQETDPNKLNDLLQKIEDYNIYTTEDVNEISRLLQESDDRSTLDPILDAVVARFKELDDDSKIDCKSAIKAYNRTYSFLSAILPYGSVDWEKSYEFLLLLVKKLPKIAIEDGTDGLIESVDFEHYKSVKQDEIDFKLTDEDSVINPIPVSGGGSMPTPDLDKLSSILQDFNAMYGNINWEHPEKVVEQIKSLPEKLAKTESFAKAVRRNDNQNAEIEAGEILVGLVAEILNEETEFARYYLDHGDFKALVNQRVFKQAYDLVRK